MAPASDGAKKPLGLWPRGQTPSAIGAPSAGLSLGGLRARRAHLRFTRRVRLSQEQSPVARPKSGGYDKQRVLNCGANGEFLLSLVGKSYCRWTKDPAYRIPPRVWTEFWVTEIGPMVNKSIYLRV